MSQPVQKASSDSLLNIEHLKKRFGNQLVLNDINLTVSKGEIVCIIGQSGCGKSVILKHIMGLLIPDGGRILLDGKEISSPRRKPSDFINVRKRLGMLFQGAALFDSRSVGENIAFPLREHSHHTEDEITVIVDNALEMVGLQPVFKTKMPSELSGGMKSRVGLARALVMNPEIMLYDEPTSALDPIMTDKINDLIVSLRNRLAMTSVVVTHNITSAYRIADRMVMVHEGSTIFSGTPAEIRASHNPYIQQFIRGQRKLQYALSSVPYNAAATANVSSTQKPHLKYMLDKRIFDLADHSPDEPHKELLDSNTIVEALNAAIDRLHKNLEPAALAICAIDNLSAVNERYGNSIGDRVIVEVGSRLYSGVRTSDHVAHLEHNEFALIITNTRPEAIASTIDSIRNRIADSVLFHHNGDAIHITASFGVAVASESFSNLTDLIQTAHLACTRAQQKGGNTVEIIDHLE
jgi:phospholipid/cholesterol/gamma-HCH transport system ATP-binding protein